MSDGTEVDSIGFADETQTFGTTVINVGSQLARVGGNTRLLHAASRQARLRHCLLRGHADDLHHRHAERGAFNGLSNLSTVATWSFTTRAAPTLTAASVTVDGFADQHGELPHRFKARSARLATAPARAPAT